MATTESRSGFRLPWMADQPEPEDPIDEPAAVDGANAATPTGPDGPAVESESVETESVAPAVAPRPPIPARRPSRFLADLTNAMRAAAEVAREQSLSQFGADAKTFIEQIHARSTSEAAALRAQSDADVAGIREWSKREIARVREETEEKIGARKAALDQEIEAQAARIEREIERVQHTVSAFEAEMAGFFERLLAEPDPTRFAALAENLPEPPAFDQPEAASAALDAAAGAADELPVADATAASDESPADQHGEPDRDGNELVADPRIAALGLPPDFAAAEAEAAAAAGSADGEEFPDLESEAIAARLAAFAPVSDPIESQPVVEPRTTSVVVVGLVSVASIAGFKRALGRIPGVSSAGVASDPDGDFVFAVRHDPGVALSEIIPTLPGFQARVTGTGDGVLRVTAQDLES